MEAMYKSYFESMPCYLTVQDRDFRIIDANEKFIKRFGDYEGRYCYQIYKQRPEKCKECPVERTFQDGKQHTSEEQVRTLDGREVSVIVYTTPIKNDVGEITAVMEMSTNITEIKNLQSQLVSSRKKYQLLFEEVPCFISMQDRDLRIVEANRLHREAFGTFYGCKCFEVYKHRKKACHPCVVLQTFQDGKIHHHEEVVTDRDDNNMNVMVTTAPVFDLEGNVDTVIEMSTDITQIRELQTKLSSVGMIIGTLSHDLKGLLNGMDGGIYLVNTGMEKDKKDRVDRGWEMVLRNVDRIRSTVLDILYYAKDRDPEWTELQAADVVDEVYNIVTPKAEKLGILCDKDTSPSDTAFEADSKAVRSMLINLVDNAFDACRVDTQKSDHKVSISVHSLPESIEFKISDNGIGMSQEVKEKAFTLFFSSKGAGGTGLGLFIANKIAQSHGGEIIVESVRGEGTSFTVSLPKVRPIINKNEKLECDNAEE